MKYLVFIIILTICCNAQYLGYENLDLRKSYWIVNEIIRRGNDLNEMVKFLSDTSITSVDRTIRFNNDIKGHVIPYSETIINQITKNKFMDGISFQEGNLKKGGWGVIDRNTGKEKRESFYFTFSLKIRNKSLDDIIWFFFDNHEDGVWKLCSFSFCNNFPQPDNDEPCDKK